MKKTAYLLLFISLFVPVTRSRAVTNSPTASPKAKYIILLIADGWGANQIEAANAYTGLVPTYQAWSRQWVSTFAAGGSYDSAQFWSDFNYATQNVTDSAASATALYSGNKTSNGNINVSADDVTRFYTISEKARDVGMAVGAASTVYISHATPAAWIAHNDHRGNGFAITDEGLWGDPNVTGSTAVSTYYAGGHGQSAPVDVLIGAGHPDWEGSRYVNMVMRDKLFDESGNPGAFTFIERIAGSADGGARLLAAANDPAVVRLAALFGGTEGNIEYRLADGSGHDSENPTLAEMTTAALTVLNRDPQGFMLLVEGGAVDWGSHKNKLDYMIGEMIGFDEAVQTVIDWVEDGANDSDWSNTLVVVTGDHETGYLTALPAVFPDQPLGLIDANTLALEKEVDSTGRRASWVDVNSNAEIDAGETVYWAWNTGGHSNSLIPLYAKGIGASSFNAYATGSDSVRGAYLDNTDVFKVMDSITVAPLAVEINIMGDDLDFNWTADTGYISYAVYRDTSPYFTPAGINKIADPPLNDYIDMDSGPVDVLGDVTTPYFYVIRATIGVSHFQDSNWVGEFDFAIVPGS